MNSKKFSAAMGEIDDKYISEAIAYKFQSASPRLRRRFPAALIAAVLALFLMGAGVAAVIYGGSIQSWFGHYWQAVTGQGMSKGQAALIEHLSQEIKLSQTVGGVTVTVDSATVGDDSFFLLLRVEGLRFSKRHSYSFSGIDMEVKPDPLETGGGIGGFGVQYHGLDGDGAVLLLMDYSYASRSGYERDTSPIDVRLSLENLLESAHTDGRKTLAEGQWSFLFSLDRSHFPETVRLPDTEVMVMDLNRQGQELVPVMIKDIELTSTGLRFQYDCEEGTLSLEAHIILNNGITIENSGGFGTPLEDGHTLNCSHQWQVPVNLDEVSAIRIGETEINVP